VRTTLRRTAGESHLSPEPFVYYSPTAAATGTDLSFESSDTIDNG
jgi:hypothetical protein